MRRFAPCLLLALLLAGSARPQDREELQALALEKSIRISAGVVQKAGRIVKDFEGVPPVIANEHALVQVFTNLLVNAGQALRGNQIDAYPEYTGTIAQEILTDRQANIRDALAKFGVGITESLGFNNTYALVMRRDRVQTLGVRTISDLRNHPELKVGLTHEFLDRQDGWRPLANRYQLAPRNLIGIDHALVGAVMVRRGGTDINDTDGDWHAHSVRLRVPSIYSPPSTAPKRATSCCASSRSAASS